jgi:8-oxo-dGTP pyrophosphatase MutT (NUDIX family)
MLVRDRPELEVLVLRRTPRAVFTPGATVFPGGAVDPADRDGGARVVGMTDAEASRDHGVPSGGLAYRVAAVRECFEEAGILLARERASGAPATPPPRWRDACNAGTATLADVLEACDLLVDARELRVFSHWLTPIGAPRRYDTWFFVAPAPDGNDGEHDDAELVASEWVRPREALARQRRGDIELITPTARSLETLARFRYAGDLLGALDAVPRDAQGRPFVVADGSGERVVLPGDDVARAGRWTIPLPDIHFRTGQRVLAEGASACPT